MEKPLPSLVGFSEKNHQWFAEGISLAKLAHDFSTPLYVYSKEAICSAYRAYDAACIRPNGTRRARIHYAMKANSNLAVLDELKQLGAGFDLVSGGELARALQIGADPKSLVFAGVGKSSAEIENALRAGVKCINVESISELQRVNAIAKTWDYEPLFHYVSILMSMPIHIPIFQPVLKTINLGLLSTMFSRPIMRLPDCLTLM